MDLGYGNLIFEGGVVERHDIRLHYNTAFINDYTFIAEAKYSSMKIIDKTDDSVTVRIYGVNDNVDMKMVYTDGEWYFGNLIKLGKSN